MKQEALYNQLDIKNCQSYGIPMLKFLFTVTVITLAASAVYEFLL